MWVRFSAPSSALMGITNSLRGEALGLCGSQFRRRWLQSDTSVHAVAAGFIPGGLGIDQYVSGSIHRRRLRRYYVAA